MNPGQTSCPGMSFQGSNDTTIAAGDDMERGVWGRDAMGTEDVQRSHGDGGRSTLLLSGEYTSWYNAGRVHQGILGSQNPIPDWLSESLP